MYLVKTPNFIRSLFPNFIWHVPTQEKTIFLTFDDGPIPEVTPWVLSQLEQYRARATFFCVGDNIRKHFPVFEQVKAAGHALGSHTFNHLSGWASENISYFHNVRHCARQTGSTLFRPPYGRLKPSQAQFLQRHYQIVMWDILSGDFDTCITPEQCLANVTEHAGPGSIIVFHDSLKARENLTYTLPRVLEHFSSLGYVFEKLDELALAVGQGLRKTA